MADVLSQNEIDSLLSSLSSGEVDLTEMTKKDEKKVADYDFRRPAKFSKEHLRTLEIIFEHYGRLLSNNLPIYLRKNVTVEVVNSETLTFNEFSNSLSAPAWKYHHGNPGRTGVCLYRQNAGRNRRSG